MMHCAMHKQRNPYSQQIDKMMTAFNHGNNDSTCLHERIGGNLLEATWETTPGPIRTNTLKCTAVCTHIACMHLDGLTSTQCTLENNVFMFVDRMQEDECKLYTIACTHMMCRVHVITHYADHLAKTHAYQTVSSEAGFVLTVSS